MIETAKPRLKTAQNRKTAPDFAEKPQTAGHYWNRKTATQISPNPKTAQKICWKPQNRTEKKVKNRKTANPWHPPVMTRD